MNGLQFLLSFLLLQKIKYIWFSSFSYAPFTREYFKSKHIIHELCKNQENTGIDEYLNKYEEARLDLKNEGFNVEEIFDIETLTANNTRTTSWFG